MSHPLPPTSIQELLLPQLDCFGCGPANPDGLQLRSYAGEHAQSPVTARFRPWPEHGNGVGYLNGGIISTLLDCHSAAAVSWEADQRGWRPEPGVGLPFVTAGLDVRFLRPAPLHQDVTLVAVLEEVTEQQMVARVRLFGPDSDDRPKAECVATWKRWRSRGGRPGSAP